MTVVPHTGRLARHCTTSNQPDTGKAEQEVFTELKGSRSSSTQLACLQFWLHPLLLLPVVTELMGLSMDDG